MFGCFISNLIRKMLTLTTTYILCHDGLILTRQLRFCMTTSTLLNTFKQEFVFLNLNDWVIVHGTVIEWFHLQILIWLLRQELKRAY